MSSSYKVTLIPGDGIGPEVVNAAVRILEATGVKFEWESFAAGAEAFEKYHEYIPKELTESIERTHVGLERSGNHAHRRRFFQHQRRVAQAVRAVRQLSPHPQSAGSCHALSRRRSRHRSREYRGTLLRHRARSRARRGGEPEDHYRESVDTHLALRLRVRAPHTSQEDSRHPQSQHHEAVGWIVHSLLAQYFEGISRDHLRRAHRGQHLHAAGDESLSVRHAAAGKPLRRHHLRLVRGVCRRTGLGAGRKLRTRVRHLRSRTRLGARHRRQRIWPIPRRCCVPAS